jgi:hypothetical protein
VIDVGTEFPFKNERLFVRLIVSPPAAPVGTLMTTGDQMPDVVAAEFNGEQVAVEPLKMAPQL